MAHSILLPGATGYLGGDILTMLEQSNKYNITCVVRPEREACLLGRKASLLVVRSIVYLKHRQRPSRYPRLNCDQASHDKLDRIEDACATVDISINAATSNNLELTQAINRGLVKAKAESNKRGVLIYISGTQLIEPKPTGKLENLPRYDDLNIEQIKSIPDSALHRLIDLE